MITSSLYLSLDPSVLASFIPFIYSSFHIIQPPSPLPAQYVGPTRFLNSFSFFYINSFPLSLLQLLTQQLSYVIFFM